MNLELELKEIFSSNSVSFEGLAWAAATVDWAEWKEGGGKSTSIKKLLAKNAKEILSLSNRESRDINSLVRNAVALTSEDQLPVARLVLAHLLHEGLLQGTAKDWFRQFPKAGSIEKFLESYIRGVFRPNQRAFAELLDFGRNTKYEETCIKNLVLSFGDLQTSTSILLDLLKRHRSARNVDTSSLFSVLQEIVNDNGLENDLDLDCLLKLPKNWRTYILDNEGLISSYLSPSLQRKVSEDPYCIPETPSSIKASGIIAQFKSELKNRIVHSGTIREIISADGILEYLDKSFDWSILNKKTKPGCLGPQSSSNNTWFAFVENNLHVPSAANLFLLHLVWLSYRTPSAWPCEDSRALTNSLTSGSAEAVAFCVRNTRGRIQRDVIIAARRRYENRDVAGWVLEGTLDEATDIKMLLGVLSQVSESRRVSVYSVVISQERLALELLEHSEEFRSFYLSEMRRGRVPEYVVTDDAFRVYGKLEEVGGAIIELILVRLNKLSNSVKAREIFHRTVDSAPGAAATVFSKRGLAPRQFAKLLSSREFEDLSENAQRGIFELKSPKGKSAFQEALRKGAIKADLTNKLERYPHLRRYLVRYCPSSLTTRKASAAENLAALVYTPSDSDKFAELLTKAELLMALPGALKLLEGRSRVSAALELAVHSKLTALPILLQLVQKLAPPFQASDLGHRFDDLYTTYELPKKSGGNRTIAAPAAHLKLAQRALLILLNEEEYSDAATGFRTGKSTLDNAGFHVGKDIVVNADIRGFFPSTPYKLVYSLARRIAGGTLSPLATRLFAEICCHNGHLATGAPTSPAVSNLILKPLDEILTKISKKLDVSYSRYADDITFSGDSAAVWMLKPLESQLARLGYVLEPKKTNIFRKGRRQTVTGAVVNEKVTLARPIRKKLRAAVHRRLNGGQPTMHGKPLSDQALKGHLAYLSMLSSEHAKPFLAKLENLEEWEP